MRLQNHLPIRNGMRFVEALDLRTTPMSIERVQLGIIGAMAITFDFPFLFIRCVEGTVISSLLLTMLVEPTSMLGIFALAVFLVLAPSAFFLCYFFEICGSVRASMFNARLFGALVKILAISCKMFFIRARPCEHLCKLLLAMFVVPAKARGLFLCASFWRKNFWHGDLPQDRCAGRSSVRALAGHLYLKSR